MVHIYIFPYWTVRGVFFGPFSILEEIPVPHNKSGLVPRSSLSGAGQLGFWETGEGGTMGEGWGK
jgi:hypothetical protein